MAVVAPPATADDVYLACADPAHALACEGLCMRRASGEACNLMARRAGRSEPAREFALSERACQLRNLSGCLHAAAMVSEGLGTPKSEERKERFDEQACDLGEKDACVSAAGAIRTKPLSATDPGHRRAEALYARGGDYAAVADIREERTNALCGPALPEGPDACIAAVRAVKEALDKETDYTDEERHHKLGPAVRWACRVVQMPECKDFPGDEDPEDVEKTNKEWPANPR